jgi:hypothetical protein
LQQGQRRGYHQNEAVEPELVALFERQNASPRNDTTSIPATCPRIMVVAN